MTEKIRKHFEDNLAFIKGINIKQNFKNHLVEKSGIFRLKVKIEFCKISGLWQVRPALELVTVGSFPHTQQQQDKRNDLTL